MLQTVEHATLEEASRDLLAFILEAENWVHEDGPDDVFRGRLMDYCRNVEALRIRASVDLTADLGVYLHVAFRAPGLTPMKAAEHLETFLTPRFPIVPDVEWHVEVDARKWIHFRRKYLSNILQS